MKDWPVFNDLWGVIVRDFPEGRVWTMAARTLRRRLYAHCVVRRAWPAQAEVRAASDRRHGTLPHSFHF